jgi:hypothetical protein
MKSIFWLALSLLASCGIYNSNFDCAPGKGVGCAPVGEVMDLIVEKKEGEDLFVSDKGKALLLAQQEEAEQEARPNHKSNKKLYLVKTEKGDLVLVPHKEGDTK